MHINPCKHIHVYITCVNTYIGICTCSVRVCAGECSCLWRPGESDPLELVTEGCELTGVGAGSQTWVHW